MRLVSLAEKMTCKGNDNFSHVIGIYCFSHGLGVSVLSAVEDTKYNNDLDSVVKLYKFCHYSPKRV